MRTYARLCNNDKSTFHLPRQHLPFPNGRIYYEGAAPQAGAGRGVLCGFCRDNPVYPPARAELAKHGISCGQKRAVQLVKEDYEKYDYLIGMEQMNIRNMMRILGSDPDHKVYRLLDFTDEPGDIADPWYSGKTKAFPV